MGQQTERAPLAGVRVLDLAPGPLGAVGRLLLELGADVVRVEPPGGGVDRTAGVTAGGVALGFAAANLGKRAVALDLTAADDRRTLDSLAASADILIEATRPGDAEAAALNVVALRKAHPGLVILSLREFGEGSLARIGEALQKIGVSRPLVRVPACARVATDAALSRTRMPRAVFIRDWG